MKRNIITLAITTLMLSSCGIYTKYQPATTVPEDLFGAVETVSDTIHNIAKLNWRQLFVDPHLQSLIEQGLRNNTDLQSAHWRVEEARASLSSARLAYLPSFAFSPQGTVSSFDKGKAGQSYSLPITSSWEIDIFGRLTNANRRAKALYIQSQEYELAVKTQLIANLANVSAALKETFHFFWVGFYLVKGEELVLGPFQGPIACTRIRKGRGVCGTAWDKDETLIVPDVDAFPGHIACSSLSRSEIVVPLKREDGEVWGVLDIDSDDLGGFDETDARFLEEMIKML